MAFELLHFRYADKILKNKGMENDVQTTLQYLDDVLYRARKRGELIREALKDMGWREDGTLTILEGRRYQYKGFKNRVAMEGYIGNYEIILEGLFRLQIGFDRETIDAGILILNSARSFDSPFGSSRELAEWEVEVLEPTISLPVTIALFDIGETNTATAPRLRESIPPRNDPKN